MKFWEDWLARSTNPKTSKNPSPTNARMAFQVLAAWWNAIHSVWVDSKTPYSGSMYLGKWCCSLNWTGSVLDEVVKAWKRKFIMSSCSTWHFKNISQLPIPRSHFLEDSLFKNPFLQLGRHCRPIQATLTVWKFDLAPRMTWSFCTLSCRDLE